MTVKGFLTYFLTLAFSFLFIWGGYNYFDGYTNQSDGTEVFAATIVSIEEIVVTEGQNETTDTTIYFTAEMENSKGNTVTVVGIQEIIGVYSYNDLPVEEGDSILISSSVADENIYTFSSYNRTGVLMYLIIFFFICIILIGRTKGLNTILSLVITCLVIFMVYLPSILSSFNVYISTIVVSIVIIVTSLLIINNFNKKTLCAILGNVGGLFVAGLLAFIFNSILKLTGMVDQSYVFLLYANAENPYNLLSILWGGMVIGSLGAVMDVSMSIASAMHEIAEHMSDKTFVKMFKSGMNIGRDAIGTMTNTLILAYIGGSIATVLLLIINNKDILYLFSLEMISIQIIQAVVGSMGILFAVPITAVCSAYLYNRSSEFNLRQIFSKLTQKSTKNS